MFNRNMFQKLYAADDSTGDPTDTQQDKEGKTGAGEKTYTQAELQAELNRIAAKEKKEGKASAQKEIFEALGITSLEDAKAALEAKKQKEEAEKTETQKLQDAIANLTKERDAEKQARLESEKAVRLVKRDAELSLLILDARNSKQVMTLLKAEYPSEMDSLISEDGNFDKEAAEKLLTAFRKDNGHLFRDMKNPGSQSNNDGKPPQPSQEAQELARKEIEQKFKL